MNDIYIGPVCVYVERDKEGYISLSTDGYTREAIQPLLDALRSLQTDDDRECEAVMNASNRKRIGG